MKIKKSMLIISFLCLLLSLNLVFSLTTISNCIQLQNISNNPTENYQLIGNIDCSDSINWNDTITGNYYNGTGFTPIGFSNYFEGTLDGQNYNITNLFINWSNGNPFESNIGLFSHINGTIKNLNLVNANIQGYQNVGVLVGTLLYEGILNNINVIDSNVFAPAGVVGCVVGSLENDIFVNNTHCLNGNIISTTVVGGIAGQFSGDTIVFEDFLTFSSVKNSYLETSDDQLGGLIGYAESDRNISNCFVLNTTLVGTDISGDNYIGGLIGYGEESYYFSITNSYSNAVIQNSTAENNGGIIGFQSTVNCNNVYWDTEVSGISIDTCGSGKTTSEMQNQSTYSGWDFVNVWTIDEGISYPYYIWDIVVEEEPEEEPQETFTQTPLYQIMDSSGAGMGLFIGYIGKALPVLVLPILVVTILSIFGIALVHIFKNWLKK